MRERHRARAYLLHGPPPGDRERGSGSNARGDAAAAQAPKLTEAVNVRLLVLLGPTGTGKSHLAVLVAERIGGEVVGCDALQVYRGFNTATAKPTGVERARVPHWLVDNVDPRSDYSLADYVRDADAVIGAIAARGRVPIVAGGTGMYLRGLLKGLVSGAPRDEVLRARLRGMAERFGSPRLHRWLARVDAGTAQRVLPGDTQRIVRGLELAVASGASWSERLASSGTWARGPERYETLKFGLELERDALSERLARRVDGFLAAGLVDEVDRLLSAGVPSTANAFKAIGYREVLRARRDGRDPSGERDAIVVATRRYAKRQMTWFRKEPGVTWIDAGVDPHELAARIGAAWDRQHASGASGSAC